MNIWTVDKATIRAEVRQRNALHKAALLPLLDEQKELDHACAVIRVQRWHVFRESKLTVSVYGRRCWPCAVRHRGRLAGGALI